MKQPANPTHTHNLYELIQLSSKSFIPFFIGIALFFGGLWTLSLDLPGWKLIIGLPAAQLGIVVLMFAFDKTTKKHLHPDNHEILICPFCNQENLIGPRQKQTQCTECQKIIKKPVTNPDED